MKTYYIFILFVIIRLCSVYFVQTWYVPDEYWQSLEVAHNLVYGYGYLTWEWILGIRSYIYPLIIATFYKLLNVTNLDYTEALIYLPRVLQALLSAYADYCFYSWSGKRKWAIFSIATSWFWFYTSSRTVINSFECALTTIALAKFPWPGNYNKDKWNFIWIVVLLCLIRPTAAIQWLPLCIYHLITARKDFQTVIKKYLQIGFSLLAVSIVIDSLAHGKFIITSYEFLKANLIDDIGTWYGVNSWHWYLSIGIPAILGIFIFPFGLSVVEILRYRSVRRNDLALLGCLVFSLFIYSFLPHKEFRFILPLLPIMLKVTTDYLSRWSRRANIFLLWLVAGIILIANMIPIWYFSLIHQRGTLDVMVKLRDIAEKDPNNTSFLFIMPCHTTPYYSHIHVNVTMKFLTCEPNFKNVDNYKDEADFFYEDPNTWFKENYPTNATFPSHIVAFNFLNEFFLNVMSRYTPTNRIYHASVRPPRIGRHIVIYERLF